MRKYRVVFNIEVDIENENFILEQLGQPIIDRAFEVFNGDLKVAIENTVNDFQQGFISCNVVDLIAIEKNYQQ